MQPLGRDGLTDAQIRALLTCDDPTFSAGLDLLDSTNRVVADISDDLDGGSVEWDNRDAIHGSVRLSLMRELAWGRDRVRPWMTVSSAVLGVSARFNLGVYILTAPDTRRGEDPPTWEVTGYDLLDLLASTGPGDTWEVVAGTTYFDAIRAVLDASGIGARLLIDGSRQDTPLPATRVWALTNPDASWLRIVRDLLAEIGYTAPWMDENGNIRARPFRPVAERPSEWTLDTSNERTNIVGEERTLSVETGDIANVWRFYRTDMDVTPTLDLGSTVVVDGLEITTGSGIYQVRNLSVGPTSIEALGREVRKVVPLQAADPSALVAQGDKIVAGDMAAVRTITLSIDPLPIMGQDDVFTYTDAGTSEKVAAASWTLNLDGSPGTLQLGGAPAEPLDQVEAQTKATVTSAAPLRVVVDGALTDSFANALDAATYAVGNRVSCTVRNPIPPLVQGTES